MTVRTTDSDKLMVTGWTNTIHFKNISKDTVFKELSDLKTSFSELRDSYNELNDLIKLNDLTVEYHVAYNDSGKAGIGLCSEINGVVNWYLDE